jgi:hypothetical protein
MAFAWKSALQTFRVVDRRVIVRVFAVLVWIAVVIVTSNQGRGLAVVAAHFAIAAAGLAVVIGPLTVKLDFREDLQHLELLKTWPVAPAAAVRGVMVWPTLLLTTIAWAMMALALLFSGSVFPDVSPVVRVTLTVASMVVSPGLIAAQLTIHNAAALAFPAWMATGGDRSKGLDAIGQRLLLIGGTMTILALMTVPAVPRNRRRRARTCCGAVFSRLGR